MTSEKTFDCVRLMRELRDEINRDIEALTPEQRVEYIRVRAERVRQDLALPAPVAPALHEARTH
jgi:hypothetical protein